MLFLGLGGAPAAQSFRQVDLELILAVDCSYSVDTAEFDLQKIGLAEAFRHPAIVGRQLSLLKLPQGKRSCVHHLRCHSPIGV